MIKCLIWDLDDTLWEGTLSEDWNVSFSENKRAIINKLDRVGILQSIASRNDYDHVMGKLDEFGIRDYFLYPQCNYGSKVDSIKKIVEKLNIGMDSIGYIDDNAFELFETKYFLPEISTYNADEANSLLSYPEFKIDIITNESSDRRKMMISRKQREEAEKAFTGSKEDFLKKCEMELVIRPAQEKDVDRIYELAVRANQLNSLGKDIDRELIREYKMVFVSELTDIFGYHGIVGTCFLEIEDSTAAIKLFCISCRIEGRGIGLAFLSEIINFIQKEFKSVSEIICKYRPSLRNQPALILLKMLGFNLYTKQDEFSIYSIKIPYEFIRLEWINVRNQWDDCQ